MNFIQVASLVYTFLINLRWPPNKSIRLIINQRYGSSVLESFRKLEKLEFKLKKFKADVAFLRTCYEKDLIPSFLNFRVYDNRIKSSRVYRECQRNFLRNELQYKERECLRVDKF